MEQLNINLSFLEAESAEEYHAKARLNLSSHQLIDFMKCPYLYRQKQLGLIERSETQAMIIGRATHCRILEGANEYKSQFAIGGPVNPRTGKSFGTNTNAFKEWASAQDKPVIAEADAALIEKLSRGVSMNSEAVDLLLYGRSEGVVRTNYCNMPSQIRIDWLHPHRGIVDLKTTRQPLEKFVSEVRKFRYHNQLAFYQAVLKEVLGEYVPCYIVAVEKVEPFRCGVWELSSCLLSQSRTENQEAMAYLKQCHLNDNWSTGYESIRTLNAF